MKLYPKYFKLLLLSHKSIIFLNPTMIMQNLLIFLPKLMNFIYFLQKTTHSTSDNKTAFERISISADVSIITKHSKNLEHLLTPIDDWMKF